MRDEHNYINSDIQKDFWVETQKMLKSRQRCYFKINRTWLLERGCSDAI